MEHFVSGTTAQTAAACVGVNPKTAGYYFHCLREIIEQASEDAMPLSGGLEVDESYFGGSRRDKRGRGAAGNVPGFGLLKRSGKVYARVTPRREESQPQADPRAQDCAQHCLLPYPELVQCARCCRPPPFEDRSLQTLLGKQKPHQRYRGFWSQAKRHLRRFNGIPKQHFYLFLKKCE
jgi:transposase